MTLRSYTLRELRRRPGRTVLTLLGIVIGVASLVAVSLATATARDAYRTMFDRVGGRAELEVVAAAGDVFDPEVGRVVAPVEGVESVVPVVQAQAALLTGASRASVLVLGIDPERDGAVRDYDMREGVALGASSLSDNAPSSGEGVVTVLLEAGFADGLGVGVGDTTRLLTPTGLADATVVGLVDSPGAAAFNGGAVVFMDITDARVLFALEGVNSLQLVLSSEAAFATVEERVAEVLPAGLLVQAPAARGDIAQESLANTEAGLSSLSGLSLVAGVFIILNAFLMSVGERRRQLAMLRALGATRRQVTRLLLREAAVLGVVGTALGLVLGLLAAFGLARAVGGLVGADLPGLALSWRPFVTGAVVGPVLALVATYVPARRAGRITPLEGLTAESPESSDSGGRRWPSYVGLALVGLSLVAAAALLSGALPATVAAPVFMALVTGCVLVVPLVTPALSRFWAVVLVPVLGMEGRLAFRQLERHRTRTNLTVGVLFVAVVVAVSMGGSLLTNVQDSADWYDRTIVGDYFVRGVIPDSGTMRAAALEPRIGQEIGALDGVESVYPFSFVQARAVGRPVIVLARAFDEGPLPLDLEEGSPEEVLAGLERGEVVLGTTLARFADVGVGGEIVVEATSGPVTYRVSGLVTEYTAGGYALYMDYPTAERDFDVVGADLYMVTAAAGRADSLGTGLRELADREGLLLQSQADFRQLVADMINGIMGFLWLLIALVFVVASLGVINTLTMNVLEQTREIGLLRAVAMTRRQLRRMILSQALGMAVVSLVPGLAVGVAVQYLLNRGTRAVSGQPVDFSLSPVVLVGTFAAALLISLLAAYFPARHAARLEVVQALQYE